MDLTPLDSLTLRASPPPRQRKPMIIARFDEWPVDSVNIAPPSKDSGAPPSTTDPAPASHDLGSQAVQAVSTLLTGAVGAVLSQVTLQPASRTPLPASAIRKRPNASSANP